MGTKGYYAIICQGKIYIFYNKFDSYPSGLGQVLLDELRNANLEEWKHMVTNAIIVLSENAYDKYLCDHDNHFSQLGREVKTDLIDHFEKEFTTWYPHTNREEAIDNFRYEQFLVLYYYSYSMEKMLKSRVLFPIYQNNITDYGEDLYYEITYEYDCSYGYVIDLDKKIFTFDDLTDYVKHIYSLSNLPKSLPEFHRY